MLEPPRDAHEAFIRLGPNLKEICGLINDRRWPSVERQRLADMLLGYFLGVAHDHKRAQLHVVYDAARSCPPEKSNN